MDFKPLLANFIRPRMGRRLLALTAGLTLIGVSVAAFRTVGFGTDPCSTFTLGVSLRTGLSYGTCQLLFNLLLFLPILRLDLSRIGIGTVGNMVGIGYIADFCMGLINRHLPPEGLSIPLRVCFLALSILVFLAAASFYIVADLGVSPYDAIPQLITSRAKKPNYRRVRVLWDVGVLCAGFLLGATVGVTTLLTGFCLGPAIDFVSRRVSPWFQ